MESVASMLRRCWRRLERPLRRFQDDGGRLATATSRRRTQIHTALRDLPRELVRLVVDYALAPHPAPAVQFVVRGPTNGEDYAAVLQFTATFTRATQHFLVSEPGRYVVGSLVSGSSVTPSFTCLSPRTWKTELLALQRARLEDFERTGACLPQVAVVVPEEVFELEYASVFAAFLRVARQLQIGVAFVLASVDAQVVQQLDALLVHHPLSPQDCERLWAWQACSARSVVWFPSAREVQRGTAIDRTTLFAALARGDSVALGRPLDAH